MMLCLPVVASLLCGNADELVNCTYVINAIRLNGLNADALQQYSASKGVYIGVGGSACNAAGDFHLLNAYGLSNAEAAEVIRVSFGDETNKNDVDALVSAIVEYKQKYC